MTRRPISLTIYLSLFAVLVLGCRGCPPRTDGPGFNGNGGSSPVAGISPTPTQGTGDSVKRVEANVRAGESQPLPLLRDDNPHDLLARMQVTTDPNGEALLKLSGCGKVYLFQTSSITYAPCSKSEAGTNFRCQTGGTAIYNSECAGRIHEVIQTPTEDINPKGTWFSVTYLPDQQLTITVVLKGSVEVRPVTDMENRTLGEPMIINAGQYSTTMPDARANQEDYDTTHLRQPKNIGDSPSEVNKYLKPWLDRIRKHAEEDKVDRQSYAFTADIDCDCEHLDAGLLNREYRLQCIRAEAEIWRRFYDTGEMGKCDSVAQGPNARPK